MDAPKPIRCLLQILIRSRPFHVIEDQNFDRTFSRDELQSELFLKGVP